MAEIAHVYLKHDSPHEVAAFCVDKDRLRETSFRGLPVVPFEEVERQFPPSDYSMFVPIGAKQRNKLRAEKYEQAKGKGYSFISYISSKATICPETSIGENAFILENNVIQPFVKIGDNVVLWSGNHIGHHAVIMNHCFITSHVVVCGRVTIGQYCYCGVNSTIRDGLVIGDGCILGARALIMRNAEPNQVFVDRPTKLFPGDSTSIEIA